MESMNSFISRICLVSLLVACFPVVCSGDMLQWRLLVPAGAANPELVGGYVNTIEFRDDVGATHGYDSGLDVDLDTTIMPNDKFFVQYMPFGLNKVEYDYNPHVQVGDEFTANLSFERNAGSTFTLIDNTIEFLSMDLTDNPNGVTDFVYDLVVDSNFDLVNDVFRSGNVSGALGQELTSWNQYLFPGQDHREIAGYPPIGFFFGTITFTAIGEDADFDNNNLVDGVDFLTLQRNFGATSTLHSEGDATGEGLIDDVDFDVWESQFGSSFPAVAATVLVPEPCSMLLALAGLICCCRRVRSASVA